jgi:arylsulfatase A-like enzyme
VAFIDDQVGIILDAVEEGPHKNNTIIVFSSDHGYHIGEKDCIQKWHLWNESTRVPLMIQVPEMKTGGGQVKHPVSLLDLYPTLADLCGLPPEPHQSFGGPKLDGYSLRPFLEDHPATSWEGPPVCLTAIRGPQAGLRIGDTDEDPHFSVCSERYRYTLCTNGEEELYDHQADPNEWDNLATHPDYLEIKAMLRAEMGKILKKSNFRPKHTSTVMP